MGLASRAVHAAAVEKMLDANGSVLEADCCQRVANAEQSGRDQLLVQRGKRASSLPFDTGGRLSPHFEADERAWRHFHEILSPFMGPREEACQ